MKINERIIMIRKKNGLSQEEFGSKIGVSRQAISKWESGSAYPDIINIINISKMFNVSTDYLLKGKVMLGSDNKLLYIGCMLVCGIISYIYGITANRFNYNEIFLITILGIGIGLGIGMIISYIYNKNKDN